MDVFSAEKRSEVMAAIRDRHTKPEIIVRKLVHKLGYRFRLNVGSLPGSPDLVFSRWRAVIFVHGCFWHRHPGCRYATNPKTRADFWNRKFEANVARDARVLEQLEKLGWRVLVVWECETRDAKVLSGLIQEFFRDGDTGGRTRGGSDDRAEDGAAVPRGGSEDA